MSITDPIVVAEPSRIKKWIRRLRQLLSAATEIAVLWFVAGLLSHLSPSVLNRYGIPTWPILGTSLTVAFLLGRIHDPKSRNDLAVGLADWVLQTATANEQYSIKDNADVARTTDDILAESPSAPKETLRDIVLASLSHMKWLTQEDRSIYVQRFEEISLIPFRKYAYGVSDLLAFLSDKVGSGRLSKDERVFASKVRELGVDAITMKAEVTALRERIGALEPMAAIKDKELAMLRAKVEELMTTHPVTPLEETEDDSEVG